MGKGEATLAESENRISPQEFNQGLILQSVLTRAGRVEIRSEGQDMLLVFAAHFCFSHGDY
jgi:hypothetical protein